MDRNFYKSSDPEGFCSNFYRVPVVIDDQEWPTTEHYYQAQKTKNTKLQEIIRLAETPHEAAAIGRALKVRDDWEDIKYSVMYKAVLHKFSQHEKLKEKLLATGEDTLVEYTVGTIRPDPVWGNGFNGEGMNWLGKICMRVRAELRGEEFGS